MKEIHSRIVKNKLMHIVCKMSDFSTKRSDLCPTTEFLQVGCFILNNGKTFKPHKHIENIRKTDITQESWIVICGKIKATLYDVDDSVLSEEILESGDCSITFFGGHNYECLEDNTHVYEFKTGPYFGQEKDKEFIS